MNEYLVPANSKKSLLIMGMFRGVDLIVAGIGIGITTIIALLTSLNTFQQIAVALIPLLVALTLVSPMPNYHNILNFLINTYKFFTNRRDFLWKGWDYKSYGEEGTKKPGNK